MRFGEYLLNKKVISRAVLEETLFTQKYTKKKLGRILRSLDHISQKSLNSYLRDFLKVDLDKSFHIITKELKGAHFDEGIKHWAAANRLIPYKINDNKVICLSNTYKDELIEEFEQINSKRLLINCVNKEIFNILVAHQSTPTGNSSQKTIEIEKRVTTEQKILKNSPYVSLFRDVLVEAHHKGASDIHIKPTNVGVSIHFRMNGDIQFFKKLNIEHREGFINEVKSLMNLSIAKFGKAQDASVMFPSWKLNIRASSLPSLYGENIVLRLLDQRKEFDLDRLHINGDTLNDFKKAISYKNGLILLSGPTGSGKTTTLFSLLNDIKKNAVNIKTIEDPIEYTLKGITQIEVTPKLSFAEILKAVLRQDPDVILVGEIRDEETAKICIKAASTGHLVLSTTHANGALENIGRLKQLGIDEFHIIETLRFSAAQRLFKRVCTVCSRPARKEEVERFHQILKKHNIPWNNKTTPLMKEITQCPNCYDQGRIPIIEYMGASDIREVNKQSGQIKKSLLTAIAERIIKQEICLREAFSYV